ncbi:trimethylguanosine synthase [Citrus sinensis]|uniref:Trimethylguanosine synthase n=1 Tax=Citrus sinensis TaxID=2711 RepID=A0ACB8KV02_CITSI|nr:trimethylguanosine synthase [Citrus sinensis]
MTRKNGKATHMNSSFCCNETKDEAEELSKVSKVETVFPTVFNDRTRSSLCCMSILGQNELSPYDVAVDVSESKRPLGEGEDLECPGWISGSTLKKKIGDGISDLVSNDDRYCDIVHDGDDMSKDMPSSTTLTAVAPGCYLETVYTYNGDKENGGHFMDYDCREVSLLADCDKEGEGFCKSNSAEQPLVADSVLDSSSYELTNYDEVGSYDCTDAFGDWKVYWDSFYMRNYFYNTKTLVSTWNPPPGAEHLAFIDNPDNSSDMTGEVTAIIVRPSISCVCSESADLCVSDNNVKSFEASFNGDRLVDQPLEKPPVQCVQAANDLMSNITVPMISHSSDHPDGIHVVAEISSDPICLLSDAQEHGHSQENKVKLGLDELSSHMQCSYDATFQVSDDKSLTSALTEAVSNGDAIQLGSMDSVMDKLDVQLDPSTSKRKKKARRRRALRKLTNANEELQLQGLIEEFPSNISKYWCQRYLLFSRFDDGIRMDEEGWFSVTPEPIAWHHAVRCGCGIIVDCFTGVGGNAIQFARRSKHVVAIDIDPKKIDYACHNATIYGVLDQIDFVLGNFFTLAPTLKADTVFLSPPWGGPDYAKVKTYDIQTMLKPHDGCSLFDCAKGIASRVVMFLPRNVNLNQLAELALSAVPSWSLEVEKNFLNGRLKAITAYFHRTAVREQ